MNDEPRGTCAPFRHDLGAYVVGGLEETDRLALEDHLGTCGECRAELDQLAGLPSLLELAREPAPQVPTRVRDRVVAAAARRRDRRRWVAAMAAAALVAGLLGVAVGSQLRSDDRDAIAIPLEGVEPFDEADGWMRLHTDGDGFVVALEVNGLPALPDTEVYEAWLSTHDERIVSIGQLDLDDGAPIELAAVGELDDYRGFWVTAEPDRRDPAHDGPTVVRAPLPDRP